MSACDSDDSVSSVPGGSLTQENLDAPWLLFEAGSIPKNIHQSRVVPYVGVKPAELEPPLGPFNFHFSCLGGELPAASFGSHHALEQHVALFVDLVSLVLGHRSCPLGVKQDRGNLPRERLGHRTMAENVVT